MSRALSLVGALSAAVLLAAGCGGSGSGSSTSSSPGSPPPSGPAPASAGSGAGAGSVQVKMVNIQFSPQATTAKVGQTVSWTNEDRVAHNVTATSGASVRSADFGPGQSFSYTPTRPGKIAYVCTIHPNMTATLTVTR